MIKCPNCQHVITAPNTKRQQEILAYIAGFIERHAYTPSYAQIARHFGLSSKATIHKHIQSLRQQGLMQ